MAALAVLPPHTQAYPLTAFSVAQVRLDTLRRAAESYDGAPAVPSLRGARLLYDARVPAKPALAIVRSILRSNSRLDPFRALEMATQARRTALNAGINPDFFCATLLQESGFDPRALSSAGAVGIAQFTLETAEAYGVDPFDWRSAMRGSARLLGGYLGAYRGTYADPYAAALAAYNAGPVAVERYRGVPPYPETRTYIGDIYDRWSRIVRDETGAGARPPL